MPAPRVQAIRRHPERAVPSEAADILRQGFIAHVGFVQDQQPFVIPFTYQYDADTPDRLYLHGSPASRTLKHLARGARVCIEVCLLDGLVYSRTAQSHSMNYRTVVCFGQARLIKDEQAKREVLEQMTRRYFADREPGRDYEVAPSEHLKAMAMLQVHIDEWSAKARSGGPLGPVDADPTAPGSAGVIDLPRPA
jgi:uncharacterized protein